MSFASKSFFVDGTESLMDSPMILRFGIAIVLLLLLCGNCMMIATEERVRPRGRASELCVGEHRGAAKHVARLAVLFHPFVSACPNAFLVGEFAIAVG